MKYKGRDFIYFTHNGERRKATCTEIEFHQGLKKWLFVGVSPYGNQVRLTKDEIHKFV